MPQTSRLYVRVGALILAGLALGLGFVLFLTGGGIGRQAMIFETYVGESVTGLEVGAAVRYRGVQVGQVSAIGLVNAEYPPSSRNQALEAFQLVLVRLALDPAKATIDSAEDAERAVGRGLRARLSSQGITGLAYIELDFVNPARFPAREDLPWEPAYPVIPAMPSTVAQVQNAAEALLSRIQQAPIEQLLGDVSAVVGLVKQQLQEGDLSRTLAEAAQTMTALRGMASETDLPGLVRELRQTVAELRGLVGGPEARATLANASAAAAELRQALARLPAAIAALEQVARSARTTTQDANADLGPLLRDLRAVAGNLRDTTEALRRAPGQAIFGAPPPAPNYR
ncbi:MlaD family protein [Pseudoroseomonas cervicalis]|uniref:MlaD family protein n=1 Tax=Teichococcus cervicalis TaxID=204525 RepID=UPI002785685F|nr:MlaD family protein [Pseudoroseomonas cervicalis]MDQ1080060.1 ABC-type transporter Mla subunit MlaD [Pseudoroseomonas cervicalis]